MIKKKLFALVLMGLMLFVMGCEDFSPTQIKSDVSEIATSEMKVDSTLSDTTVNVASMGDYMGILKIHKDYKVTVNLTNDLDFGGAAFLPLLNIVAFRGNNHTISNFHIEGDVELLSTVSDSVCDLTLEIMDMGNGSNSNFGALVGYLGSSATIKNCHVKRLGSSPVTVKGYNYVGGLVGASEGTIDSCSVSGITVQAAFSAAGGLVGYNKGKITNCSVNDVTVTAPNYHVGGLAGYSSSDITNCSVYSATVSSTANRRNYVGGLVGEASGSAKITECIVKDATISGYYIIGGLIGQTTNANTISKCCVDTVFVTATGEYLGGIVAYNAGTITDCSVSRSALSSPTFLGGIVAGNATTGIVIRCLITGSTITSTNQDPKKGYIAGIVGYNNGIVEKCVAMIKYFDVRALYTKTGNYFGRIVAHPGGTLSNNYGWVETTIRVYEKRYGVNWGSDYYRGTGDVGRYKRNGDNLYTGDVYSVIMPRSKESSFWAGLGFTSANGWYTDNVSSDCFPKLTMVKDSAFGGIGSARGFEYEVYQLDRTGNTGYYNSAGCNNPNGVKIFTPQFFAISSDVNNYAKIYNVNCDLYTDIYLSADNGYGSSVFWGVDLNNSASGNFTWSAIRYEDGTKPVSFNGNGHSISEYCRYININSNYSGFFYVNDLNLTIEQLQIENPYCSLNRGSTNDLIRFGFLISQTKYGGSGTIKLEDIYVKNPRIDAVSGYPAGFDESALRFDYNGMIGTLIGFTERVVGHNLVAYFPPTAYIRATYSDIGCLFGYVRSSIKIDGAAVSVASSEGPNTPSFYDDQLTSYTFFNYSLIRYGEAKERHYNASRDMLVGYICAYGGTNPEATLYTSFTNIGLHDGFDGNITGMNWSDYFPNPNGEGAPLPWILKLGETFDGRDCGADYPNQGSFYKTLVKSGIKDQPNWVIPSGAATYSHAVYLKRNEYTGSYN